MSPDKSRRLTLIRHATADQDSGTRDFDRPLSRKGGSEAQEMARRFQERGLVPDLILVSAAVRTRETADIFAKVLGVAARLLQADDSLYLADGEHILSTIRGVGPRVSHLMVIGHNPGISAAAIAPGAGSREQRPAQLRHAHHDRELRQLEPHRPALRARHGT